LARSDSDRGAALQSAAQPAHGGVTPELVVYGALDLGFRRGFHLWHWGDVKNLICSPWEDVGQQWRLVWSGRLDPSSASIAAGSGAAPAKPRAPAWAAAFGETPGVVDLAWAAAHRRGSELNTTARVSIFAGQNLP
jgi:hypothetical protein